MRDGVFGGPHGKLPVAPASSVPGHAGAKLGLIVLDAADIDELLAEHPALTTEQFMEIGRERFKKRQQQRLQQRAGE